jgi:hypothetical protein
MPWPQLPDATSPDWHVLAKQCNVRGLPAFFLIDRRGVLRSIAAKDDAEKLIPKLLGESTQNVVSSAKADRPEQIE